MSFCPTRPDDGAQVTENTLNFCGTARGAGPDAPSQEAKGRLDDWPSEGAIRRLCCMEAPEEGFDGRGAQGPQGAARGITD